MILPDLVWMITNVLLALALAVCSVFRFTIYAADDFLQIFLLYLDVIIMISPISKTIQRYHKFLQLEIGPPILLIVVCCFQFHSYDSFCTGWLNCYSNTISIVIAIICTIQICLRQSDVSDTLSEIGQGLTNTVSNLDSFANNKSKSIFQPQDDNLDVINIDVPSSEDKEEDLKEVLVE